MIQVCTKIWNSIKFFIGFILGFLFALITLKIFREPQTVITNRIGKIKSKGKDNQLEVENVVEVKEKTPKKGLKLFRSRKKKRNNI